MSERRDYRRMQVMIEKAYYTMLFRKKSENITVKDILEEADISRGTFYAHFKDIPDLSEQVENKIVESIIDTLTEVTFARIREDPKDQVEKILSAVMEQKQKYGAVLSMPAAAKAVQTMKRLFIQALEKEHLADIGKERIRAIDVCVAGAAFDACMDWISDDRGVSREVLIDTISAFLSGGLTKSCT